MALPTTKSAGNLRARRQISESQWFEDQSESRPNPRRPDPEWDLKMFQTRQSRPLPGWVWNVLCRCLGIKKHNQDWAVLGRLLKALTVLTALAFVVSYFVWTVFDVYSKFTKQSALTGSVSVVMAVFWAAMGVYANHLAAKLFASSKFAQSVRLHSKTIGKVSASMILIIFGVSVITLNDIQAKQLYTTAKCVNLTSTNLLCDFMFYSRVSYSIFTLFWNLLVGIVLLSVCRTHTIAIRRFIQELEADGALYEQMFREEILDNISDGTTADLPGFLRDQGADNYLADNRDLYRDYYDESAHGSVPGPFDGFTFYPRPPQAAILNFRDNIGISMVGSVLGGTHLSRAHSGTLLSLTGSVRSLRSNASIRRSSKTSPIQSPAVQRRRTSQQALFSTSRYGATDTTQEPLVFETEEGESDASTEYCVTFKDVDPVKEEIEATDDQPLLETNSQELIQPAEPEPGTSKTEEAPAVEKSQEVTDEELSLLTCEEILLAYWKIGCRLRSTSLALQRWLTMWITFILLWSAVYLVEISQGKSNVMEIIEFVLPILIIPLLCSAYGEVNNEGIRMMKSICPTPERIDTLYFLTDHPLQMTAFGTPVTYSTVVTVVAALGLAFFSKVLLEQVDVDVI